VAHEVLALLVPPTLLTIISVGWVGSRGRADAARRSRSRRTAGDDRAGLLDAKKEPMFKSLARLALAACIVGRSDSQDGSTRESDGSYAGQVLLRTMSSNLEHVMVKPFESVRFSQSSMQFGFLGDLSSAELLRQWVYSQILALGVGDVSVSSIDMIYVGLEDGLFVGYFSPASYTERAAGAGSAADLPWSPYALDTLAAHCGSEVRCVDGKTLALACDAGAERSGSCRSLLGDEVVVADEAACQLESEHNSWYAPCTTSGCCDASIRNYYATSLADGGAPVTVTRWRTYDPRHRSWYKEMKAAYLDGNAADGMYSSAYEFATTQALGLTAMVPALGMSSEFLGVFAIDYDVGQLSSQINASLSGDSSWGFAVERSNGLLVGTSSGEKLYDKAVADESGFYQSRLSAVNSRHSGIAAAAATLAAADWPGDVYHRSTESEFETTLLTVHGLDWLVVAGIQMKCEENEVWRSAAGMCKVCSGGTEPVEGLCATCPLGHAGTDGRCARCSDGEEPNRDKTACVRCADGFAGTGGLCVVCQRSQQSSADFTSCICGPGRYDSWCSVESAREAIETGGSCKRDAPATKTADPSCPCVSYPWANSAAFVTPNSSDPETLTLTLPNATGNGRLDDWIYPTSYGMDVCAAHDLRMHPYCADGVGNPLPLAPSWCDDPFCFVDAANCALDSAPSHYFPSSGLHYSYATCGSTDTFIGADGQPVLSVVAAEVPANPLHVFVWTGAQGRSWHVDSALPGDDINRAWDPAANNDRCIECPLEGMMCRNGVARPKPGYHEIAVASSGGYDQHFFECYDEEHCVGLGSNSSVDRPVGSCVDNHAGLICASCENGYGMQVDACILCEGLKAGRVLLTVVLMFGSMVLLFAIAKKLAGLDLMQMVRCGFQPMRILVSYAQLISLLGPILNFRYPGWFGDFVDAIRPIVEPWKIFFRLLEPAACLELFGISLGGFHAQWVLNVVAQPIILILVLALLKLASAALNQRWSGDVLELTSGLFLIFFFCYPTMLALSVSSFICTTVDKGNLDAGIQQRQFLDADDTVFCEDAAHKVIQVLSLVMFFVIGCVVPLWFARVLWKRSRANIEWRRELRVKDLAKELRVSESQVKTVAQAVRISSRFSIVINTYKPSYIWWESVECGRKLLIVVAALFCERGTTAQLIVAILISITFLLLQLNYWPHKDRWDNTFKAMTEFHIFFAVVTALALKQPRAELAREVLDAAFYEYFLGVTFLALIPLGLIVTVVCKMRVVKALLRNRYEQGTKMELRRAFDLYSAGVPADEHREILNRFLQGWQVGKPAGFAAFLSHYKNEAGDIAAMLKPKLVDAMPGLKRRQIFLDSDNLNNLIDIPKHVADSDVIVLLLTPEVLSRPWCLVELYTAVQEKKPLIVLELGGKAKATDLRRILDDLPEFLTKTNPAAGAQLEELHLSGVGVGETLRDGMFHPERYRVMQFSSQASSDTINTQTSMLTRAIAEMTGGENSVLAQMNELHGEAKTQLGLEASHCICIVSSMKDYGVWTEAERLKSWLVARTDLTEDQIVLNEQPENSLSKRRTQSEKDSAELARQMTKISTGAVSDNIISSIREPSKVAVVVMLQTANILKEPRCVAQLYEALSRQIPVVPVVLCSNDRLQSGLRYSFERNKALMQDLSKNGEEFVSDLNRICLSEPISTISTTLSKRIPYAISKPLHMVDASVFRTMSSEEHRQSVDSVELAGIALALRGCLDNDDDVTQMCQHKSAPIVAQAAIDDAADFTPTRRKNRIMSAVASTSTASSIDTDIALVPAKQQRTVEVRKRQSATVDTQSDAARGWLRDHGFAQPEAEEVEALMGADEIGEFTVETLEGLGDVGVRAVVRGHAGLSAERKAELEARLALIRKES
jgi:hypothetical protein